MLWIWFVKTETFYILCVVKICKPVTVHQLLFELGLVFSLIVTTANYGILKEPVGGASDIHGHVMNCKFLNQHFSNKFILFIAVVMGSQLLFLNTPIRIFHVIYGWMLALLYCLNTYIAFKVDERRNRFKYFIRILHETFVVLFNYA